MARERTTALLMNPNGAKALNSSSCIDTAPKGKTDEPVTRSKPTSVSALTIQSQSLYGGSVLDVGRSCQRLVASQTRNERKSYE